MNKLKPFKDWKVKELAWLGWILLLLASNLSYVLPPIWVFCGAAAYLVFGISQMVREHGPQMASVTTIQMVGLAMLWPISVKNNIFRS